MKILFLFLLVTNLLHAAPAPKEVDVVIIGAGLSGLETARLLKEKNLSYHLLEISPNIGGRVRTVKYKLPGMPEIKVDSGMEEYWESNPAVQVLKQLKLPVKVESALASMKLTGTLYGVGLETLEEYRKRVFTEPEFKALEAFKKEVTPLIHSLRELHLKHLPVPKGDLKLAKLSFKDYIEGKKLPLKVSEWIRVSVECEIGTHWDRFSALDGLYEFHIFLGEGEKSYRVLGGNDQFTEGFAKLVGKQHISLNHRVMRVKQDSKGAEVSYLNLEKNVMGVVKAKHVVSTVPLYRLFELQLDPPLPENVQTAISSMSWGSYFKAHVFLTQSASKFWTVKGESILPLLSDTDLGVIYEGDTDEKSPSVLSLLIFGDTAERYNMAPQGQITEELKKNFDTLWPGISKSIQHLEYYRYHPRAIAGWPVGRSRFDAESELVRAPHGRFYLAGDHTEGTHSDGAFIAADRVVGQIRLATQILKTGG